MQRGAAPPARRGAPPSLLEESAVSLNAHVDDHPLVVKASRCPPCSTVVYSSVVASIWLCALCSVALVVIFLLLYNSISRVGEPAQQILVYFNANKETTLQSVISLLTYADKLARTYNSTELIAKIDHLLADAVATVDGWTKQQKISIDLPFFTQPPVQ